MHTQELERNQVKTIESIKYSFETNFICSIKRNSNDPFIVGQVAASLIDQLSGFLFSDPLNERVGQFIQTYLERYKEPDLYTILRKCGKHSDQPQRCEITTLLYLNRI